MCLADSAYGKSYKLHASRPAYIRSRDLTSPRGDAISWANEQPEGVIVPEAAAIATVTISGPTETRAGYHGECGGWSDGYDAIADRMIDAFADADVLLVFEEAPGGAVMGIVECVSRVLAAKAQYGRRCYVVVNSGMAASAAYWLACSFADPGEFYVSAGSMVGSIGARSAHVSEAGALAQAGLEWTDFAYPAGKVALSPARALNETGKTRGERDVMAAVNSFFGAVTAARPWLTRGALIALDADMRIGAEAQAAGLCDGVATLEDVEAWALSRAGVNMPPNTNMAAEDMPPAKPGAPPPPPEDAKAECLKCAEPMKEGARFCARCGTKVTAADPEEEEAPPSSKPAPMPPSDASVATMLGLPPRSGDVPIKTAVHALIAERDHVRHALGAADFGEARGKLSALKADARQGVKAAQDLKAATVAAEGRERIDLLVSLAKANLPGFPRGDLLIDIVTDAGVVTGMKAAGIYAALPVAELRGFVKGKLANAGPSAEQSPYVATPSEERAKDGSKGAPMTASVAALAAQSGISAESIAAASAFLNETIGVAQ